VQCALELGRVLAEDHRVHVEGERHGRVAELVHAHHGIEAAGHPDLVERLSEGPDVRDHVHVAGLRELGARDRLGLPVDRDLQLLLELVDELLEPFVLLPSRLDELLPRLLERRLLDRRGTLRFLLSLLGARFLPNLFLDCALLLALGLELLVELVDDVQLRQFRGQVRLRDRDPLGLPELVDRAEGLADPVLQRDGVVVLDLRDRGVALPVESPEH